MKLTATLLLMFCISMGFSQSFSLNDTSFTVGDIYRPDTSIYFDFDKANIQERSFYQLDLVASFLITNPTLQIEIGAHSDTRGSNMYSRCLTCNRARSVKQYLIDKGISVDRLIDKGYSEHEPLIPESEINKLKTAREKEEAHATNRRVEFKIVGFIE